MKPIHFPEGQPDGPWGVNAEGGTWYVIHKDTLRKKAIGRVIGFGPVTRSKPNYFDRAMEEARKRNLK